MASSTVWSTAVGNHIWLPIYIDPLIHIDHHATATCATDVTGARLASESHVARSCSKTLGFGSTGRCGNLFTTRHEFCVRPFRASIVFSLFFCVLGLHDCTLYVITFHLCFCIFQYLGHLFRICFASFSRFDDLDSIDHSRHHDVTARDKEALRHCWIQAMRASSSTKQRRNIRVHC